MISKLIKNTQSSFVKNFGIYTISSYVNKAIPFLLLPLMTNYMSTDDYGETTMFLALTSLIMSIIGWGIDGALLRKYYEVPKNKISNIIGNYLILLMGSSLVIYVVLLLSGNKLEKYIGVSNLYFPLAIVFSVFSIVCACVNAVHQAERKPMVYAFFTNSWTLVNALLSILFVVCLERGALGRILGITISAVVIGLIGLFLIRREVGIDFSVKKSILKEELVVFGIPLLPMNLKGTILEFTDRIFIANIISVSASGIYAVGNQFALVVDVFVRSMALALTPWIYEKLRQSNQKAKHDIVRLVYLLGGAIVLISTLWYFIAQLGLKMFINEAYWDARAYLGWLILSKAFIGMQLIMVNFIYYTKKTNMYALISFITIILNICLNYLFALHLGAIGVAQATVMVYGITLVMTMCLVYRLIPLPWFSFFRK